MDSTLDDLTIVVQSDEDVQHALRFRTYLNYLEIISNFLEPCESNPKKLIKNVIKSKTFCDIQGGRCTDFNKLGKLLRNCWLTEIQLNLTFEDYVSYSNHWAPVQVYYATYLALRAFYVSMGITISHEHSTTLKNIGEDIKRRPELFPRPWKVICIGDPKNEIEILNHPEGTEFKKSSALNSNLDIWSSYRTFLKTTRERQLEKICDDWKRSKHKKRISEAQRLTLVNNLAPTSFFNVLYRLRLRSNYEDADSFLVSIQETDEALRFNKALKKISWCTLFTLETLIARYIKKTKFEEIVHSFQKHEKIKLSEELVGKRMELIKEAW